VPDSKSAVTDRGASMTAAVIFAGDAGCCKRLSNCLLDLFDDEDFLLCLLRDCRAFLGGSSAMQSSEPVKIWSAR
jgi:hypothetical protein